MKGVGWSECVMERDDVFSLIAVSTKESSKRENSMVMVKWNGVTADGTRGNGTTAKCMDKERR